MPFSAFADRLTCRITRGPRSSPSSVCGSWRTRCQHDFVSMFLFLGRSSALHRICEHQAICRVHLRVIETSYNPWERVFDGVDVTPSLQLQVHMLKARPRALPRRADRADPLATLDILPDPYGDLGEVAIDRSE